MTALAKPPTRGYPPELRAAAKAATDAKQEYNMVCKINIANVTPDDRIEIDVRKHLAVKRLNAADDAYRAALDAYLKSEGVIK